MAALLTLVFFRRNPFMPPQYYKPAFDSSPAAHPGIPLPGHADLPSGGGDSGGTDTPAGAGEDGDAADAGTGPGGADSELSWLLPPGASEGCQAVLDINGERPATIIQTFQTVRIRTDKLGFRCKVAEIITSQPP